MQTSFGVSFFVAFLATLGVSFLTPASYKYF